MKSHVLNNNDMGNLSPCIERRKVMKVYTSAFVLGQHMNLFFGGVGNEIYFLIIETYSLGKMSTCEMISSFFISICMNGVNLCFSFFILSLSLDKYHKKGI